MNARTLAILAILAGGVCVAAYFASRDRSVSGSSDEPGPLFPALDARANDVARIEVTRGDQSVVVALEDGAWTVPALSGYPADREKVRAIVVALADLGIVEPKTKKAANYPRLGVEDPGEGADSTLLTLKDADGTEIASVILGEAVYERTGTKSHVRRAGEAQAYLCDARIDAAAAATGWIDTTIVRLGATRVRSARIEHADGEVLEVYKDAPSQVDYTVVGVPAERHLQHDAVGNPVATPLSFLSLDEVKPAAEVEGLEVLATSTYVTYEGLELAVRVRRTDDETWITLLARAPAEAEPDEAAGPAPAPAPGNGGDEAAADREAIRAEAQALNERLAPWAFRVPSYKGDVFLRRMDDLLAEPRTEGDGGPAEDGGGTQPVAPEDLPPEVQKAIEEMLQKQAAESGGG